MTTVDSNEVYASIMTLVLAIVSGVFCLFVVMSIRTHPKSKDSYHLRIVYNLLMVDLLMSGFVVFYYILQYILTSRQLNTFCHFYLPAIIYLFLTSFAFTIMFALRFRVMKKPDNVNKLVTWKPPIPFGRLWVFPLIYVLPLFIFAYTLPSVTKVFVNSSDTDQSCTFDHDNTDGVVLDLIYFEIPCVFTIAINFYSYAKGLIALKNAPQSVLGRQMRRAGGYLSILLIVWIPNIIYNFLSIFTAKDYTSFLNLCVVLSSSQGFLNVCVYVWSDPGLRRFIRKNAFYRKYFLKKGPIIDSQNKHDSNTRASGMLRNSNTTPRPSRTDDSIEDSYGDTVEFEGIDTKTIRSSRVSDLTNSRQSAGVVRATVQNPMAPIRDSLLSAADHRRSDETDDGTKSGSGPKSILIPRSRFSLKQQDLSTSVGDLDQEKFVRFGETSTRFISSTTEATRPSERDSFSAGTSRTQNESTEKFDENDYPFKTVSPFTSKNYNEESDSRDGRFKGRVSFEERKNISPSNNDEEEDDDLYESDDGDDIDVDIESNLKARDSSHKIFNDFRVKSKFVKDKESENHSNGSYVPPNLDTLPQDDRISIIIQEVWKPVNL